MITHLTNKEIDNLVSGLASDQDVKMAKEHLTSCPQCRKIVDALSYVTAKQTSDAIPGEHVRDAVIAEWYKQHNNIVENKIPEKPRMKILMGGLALAASVVIAVFSYIITSTVKVDNGYPLTITSIAGDVYINNSITAANIKLQPGDIINTSVGSSVVVSSDGYTLNLSELSSLTIPGNDKINGIIFSLNHGSVISKSSGSIIYRFECGKYKIVPAGTEFILQFSKDKLDISVSQGKVTVSDHEFNIEINTGMKWSSVNSADVETIDTETSSRIKELHSSVRSDITPPSHEGDKNSDVKNARPGVSKSDGAKSGGTDGNENTNTDDGKNEKMEKTKLNRELRDEMNEIKKEQKKEQRKEKGGRNNK